MDKRKILIFKTGYSEVLDKKSNSRRTSFGDILRTTVLLHKFKNDNVTWVTDKSAFPLLVDNPYINRLLPYDFTTALQLESEEFDTIINLEKIPGICALSDKIKGWRRYGFRFDTKKGEAEAYDKASEILNVGSDFSLKKENQRTAQELLFESVGRKWHNEEYILGYNPKSKEEYDIGLNTLIGPKWPIKAWPAENWDILEKLLKQNGYSVSRQDKQGPKVLQNLFGYMDWINSCKSIISNDSFGLHLGIVLKKKVLGLFGPIPHKEVHFYGRGKAILPEPVPECLPCFKGITCSRGKKCMEDIQPKRIFEEIKQLLK